MIEGNVIQILKKIENQYNTGEVYTLSWLGKLEAVKVSFCFHFNAIMEIPDKVLNKLQGKS